MLVILSLDFYQTNKGGFAPWYVVLKLKN